MFVKPYAPTIYMSVQNAKVKKGHNSYKINSICFKVNEAIYSSAPICSQSFKALAQKVIEILLKRKAWQRNGQTNNNR